MDQRIIPINENETGKRIDQFLAKELLKLSELAKYKEFISRSLIKDHLLKFFKVNGKSVKPSFRISCDDELIVDNESLIAFLEKFLEEKESDLVPQEGELDIHSETEDYIVLNKPHGMVVHPGVGHQQDTLANYLKGYLINKGEFDSSLDRAGIVHRLDKPVGGLMVTAKNKSMQKRLKEQFENHKVFKVYKATVKGLENTDIFGTPIDFKDLQAKVIKDWSLDSEVDMNDWHKLEGYIGRHPVDRIKMQFSTVQLTSDGRKAVSYIRLLDDNQLAVRIVTGRMHQIRASLKHLRLVIEGDTLYGQGRTIPNRIELVSSILGFRDKNETQRITTL